MTTSATSPTTWARYISLFDPRRDAYGIGTGQPSLRYRYRHVRAPLTPAVLAAAWTERQPIALYPETDDRMTRLGAIDVDLDERGVTVALAIQATLARLELPSYVEPSRRDRAHLWLVTTERIPTGTMRRLLDAAVGAAADIADFQAFEFRPWGHGPTSALGCIRGPMQPHHADGASHPLVAAGGAVLDDLDTMLERFELCDAARIAVAVAHYPAVGPETPPFPIPRWALRPV